jgi:hypothetical protein
MTRLSRFSFAIALCLTFACDSPPEPEARDMSTPPAEDMGTTEEPEKRSCRWMEHVQGGECVPCPEGTERLAGDDPNGPDTECEVSTCEENQRVQRGKCVPCPDGSEHAAGDPEAGPDTECEAILCNTNERVSMHSCIPCRAGTLNEPFDDATGESTLCDPLYCPSDHKVVDHRCVNCEPGGVNDEGDDASGADTRCEPIEYCLQNERVLAGRCVSCSPGTFTLQESPSNGGDTECEPVLCDEDRAVQAHFCVECGEFEINEAGDDASGGDTTCDDACVGVWQRPCEEVFLGHYHSTMEQPNLHLGLSLDIEGTTLVVGALGADTHTSSIPLAGARDSGAAMVFEHDGVDWTETAILTPVYASPDDQFGFSASISGDTIVVGAPQHDSAQEGVGLPTSQDNSAVDNGAAYVFQRGTDGTWNLETMLKPHFKRPGGRFGDHVLIDGDSIFVGSPQRSNENPPNGSQDYDKAGAVYTFERGGDGSWQPTGMLLPENPTQNGFFGDKMSIEARRLAIAAPGEDAHHGAVYIYEKESGVWVSKHRIQASNSDAYDGFGRSISLEGDRLVIGASGEDSSSQVIDGNQVSNSAYDAGAAYVFDFDGVSWNQTAYLKPHNLDGGDKFGTSVLLSGDRIFVGSYNESSSRPLTMTNPDDNTLHDSGAVYIFKSVNGTWRQERALKSPIPGRNAHFGANMAVSGDRLFVGETGFDTPSESDEANIEGRLENNGGFSVYDTR